jgi:diguanylate cyclase (GGDEF)-like protein
LFAFTWYVAVLGGGALLAWAAWIVVTEDVRLLATSGAFLMIAGLLVLGELRPVVGAGHDPYGVVTSHAFVFAVLYVWGIAPALVLVGVATLTSELVRRKAPWKVLFNVGQYVLSVAAVWPVMLAFGVEPTPANPTTSVAGTDLVWVALTWVVMFVVNGALVAGVAGDEGQSFREAFVEDFGYYAVTHFAVFALSPLLVIVALNAWTLIPLLVLPLFAVYKTASMSREKDHQARHDSLTGLPNRTLLLDRLDEAVDGARRDGETTALLMLDLDHFKDVNDTLGHQVGDRLLEVVGDRVRDAVRPQDTVARLGGDEFAVVLPRVHDVDAATEVAERVRAALAEPFHLEGVMLEVEASIGMALFPAHGTSPAELMQRADIAMYQAKDERTGVEAYRADRDQHSTHRLGTLAALRRALEQDELELHYQPKVALNGAAVTGVEALVRWRHPTRGLVMPDEFVPLAESSGLMHKLTAHVIDEALAQTAAWHAQGMVVPVAVNISVRDLHGLGLAEVVERGLERHDVPSTLLQLEITERILMDEPGLATDTIDALGALGVRLSLDDFGTGYSSLVMLKRLPVTEVKIDRSFVRRMTIADDDATIVRSIVELSHALGLQCVAEGVETEETFERLRALGCDSVQGWLISKALPAEEATAWLTSALAAPEIAHLPEVPRLRVVDLRDDPTAATPATAADAT